MRPLAGSTPNVHWRYVDTEELRAHPRYLSLPPVSSLELCGPASFRWIRQEEPLWDAVHEGVLTSRHLISVLGFREPAAARSLGLSRAMESPDAMRRVYDELRMADPRASAAASELRAERLGRQPSARRDSTVQTAWAGAARARRHVAAAAARRRGARRPRRINLECAVRVGRREEAALAAVLQYDEAATMEEIGLAMVDLKHANQELRAAARPASCRRSARRPALPLRLGGGAAWSRSR